MDLRALLIGACAALACSAAWAQDPSEFAAADARLRACIARDSSNAHIQACTSVVQEIADARLNAVYGSWTHALKHSAAADARDDAEVLKRLVAAERVWIDFRDKECSLQSTFALGGTGETAGGRAPGSAPRRFFAPKAGQTSQGATQTGNARTATAKSKPRSCSLYPTFALRHAARVDGTPLHSDLPALGALAPATTPNRVAAPEPSPRPRSANLRAR